MKAHREVIRGAIWNLLGYAVAGIGALTLPIILIKSIGREAYGIYSYIMLLLTQAYLLMGGLGEALAYYLTTYRGEAIHWVRHALGAALLTGALGFALWLWRGPEMLIALLSLEGHWPKILSEMRLLTGLALLGYEIAILLGWVPLALGWRRSLVLLPLGQLATQVVLPILVVMVNPRHLRLLFEVSMYGGITLGVYMWVVISFFMGQPLWPAFSWRVWSAFWRRGLWQSLGQWNGLFLNFFERTIIGRWASLSYMGLYGAGQYLSSKAFQVLYKATESLLSAFGGDISVWRRYLRLGQTLWFVAFISAPALMLAYGVGVTLLPHLVKAWNLKEARLWGGLLCSTQFLFITTPLVPFFIGSGQFRTLYFYSLSVVLCQVGATMGLVPHGYYYWAPAVGVIGGLGFLTLMVFRQHGVGALWQTWVLWPLTRLIVAWGIVLGPLVLMDNHTSMISLTCSFLGILAFFLGEKYNLTWSKKKDFLIQIGQASWSFLGARLTAIGLWRLHRESEHRRSNLTPGSTSG